MMLWKKNLFVILANAKEDVVKIGDAGAPLTDEELNIIDRSI